MKDRNKLLISLAVAFCVFGYIFVTSKQDEKKQANFAGTMQSLFVEQTATKKAEIDVTKEVIKKTETEKEAELIRSESLKNSIHETLPGIVCWGDSLTAGAGGAGTTYPNVLQSLIAVNIYPNIPVTNCGVGGETSTTIIGRAGSVPFVIADPMTIPGDLSKVKITFISANGSPVAPLRQGDCGVNPVIIHGINGNINIEQESADSKDYSYYFSRSTAGEAVNVESGTKLLQAVLNYIIMTSPLYLLGQTAGGVIMII